MICWNICRLFGDYFQKQNHISRPAKVTVTPMPFRTCLRRCGLQAQPVLTHGEGIIRSLQKNLHILPIWIFPLRWALHGVRLFLIVQALVCRPAPAEPPTKQMELGSDFGSDSRDRPETHQLFKTSTWGRCYKGDKLEDLRLFYVLLKTTHLFT